MPIERQAILAFSKLELLAKQVVEGFITGLHKSPFHGFSVEFAEHRLYNSGESTKYIDWKLFARTDKLFVKRFEEETNLRCHFVLDQSSSMYFPTELKEGGHTKLSFSIYSIAALMELLKKQRDAIGLSTFDTHLNFSSPAKLSILNQNLIYNKLETLLDTPRSSAPLKTHLIETLNLLAQTLPKRSLVLIFTDAFSEHQNADALLAALQHLKHNKHEVVLYHVADYDKELDFNFENRPYKFVDLESLEEVHLQNNSIRETYVQHLRRYLEQLKLKCGSSNIDFIEADINQGFAPILLSYLLKRQRIFK